MNNLTGRSIADLNLALYREIARTDALTERLAMAEGDIEKIQAVIGRLTTQFPMAKPRLVGVDCMQPSDEQWCDNCGEQGHSHCVERAWSDPPFQAGP